MYLNAIRSFFHSVIKNREPWFSTIPASSSSDEEVA